MFYCQIDRFSRTGMPDGVFIRLMSTCSMSMASIGIPESSSSGTRTRICEEGKRFLDFRDGFRYDFFYHFILFFQFCAFAADLCDRESVFYHLNEPFCVMMNVAEQAVAGPSSWSMERFSIKVAVEPRIQVDGVRRS